MKKLIPGHSADRRMVNDIYSRISETVQQEQVKSDYLPPVCTEAVALCFPPPEPLPPPWPHSSWPWCQYVNLAHMKKKKQELCVIMTENTVRDSYLCRYTIFSLLYLRHTHSAWLFAKLDWRNVISSKTVSQHLIITSCSATTVKPGQRPHVVEHH